MAITITFMVHAGCVVPSLLFLNQCISSKCSQGSVYHQFGPKRVWTVPTVHLAGCMLCLYQVLQQLEMGMGQTCTAAGTQLGNVSGFSPHAR